MRYEMAQNEGQILIVEDDEVFANGLKDYLIYQGFFLVPSLRFNAINLRRANTQVLPYNH
jgi:hypothetical protein